MRTQFIESQFVVESATNTASSDRTAMEYPSLGSHGHRDARRDAGEVLRDVRPRRGARADDEDSLTGQVGRLSVLRGV